MSNREKPFSLALNQLQKIVDSWREGGRCDNCQKKKEKLHDFDEHEDGTHSLICQECMSDKSKNNLKSA